MTHPTALIEITATHGSAPREAGAWMLVTPSATARTIGGGRLEQLAIERAREALRERTDAGMEIPLGPEIGQCCGGRVELSIRVVDAALQAAIEKRAEAERAARPHVFVFGHGHVGAALARALALLPLAVTIVETRPDFAPLGVTLAAVPEQVIDAAPPGAAFVILTHDHALDYLLTVRALERGDAAYVGLIGSKTKRATFASKMREEGKAALMGGLVCPLAADAPDDKRPEVIAAFTAAEVMRAVA